jgi:hypothetical protein
MSKTSNKVFTVRTLARASAFDLIELLPVPGESPLYIARWILEVMTFGIVHHEFIHLSGPTGSAKSSLIEAMCLVPDNFSLICHSLGFEKLPVKLYPIEMATFETPGELYTRRSLKDGATFDEKSEVIRALEDASKLKERSYPLIWLREMGRVYSSTVLGGLLNLMTKGRIVLPDGAQIGASHVAWIADSNYQAESQATHTLVSLDDSLRRRFSINLTLDYLTPRQELRILQRLDRDTT